MNDYTYFFVRLKGCVHPAPACISAVAGVSSGNPKEIANSRTRPGLTCSFSPFTHTTYGLNPLTLKGCGMAFICISLIGEFKYLLCVEICCDCFAVQPSKNKTHKLYNIFMFGFF